MIHATTCTAVELEGVKRLEPDMTHSFKAHVAEIQARRAREIELESRARIARQDKLVRASR